MNNLNLYWPVYKNLEKEFLLLSEYIHFSDDQIGVYSMHIADLIIRCSIEIEAISKELYLGLTDGTSTIVEGSSPGDLYFDTVCLNLLENKWKLGAKKLLVSASSFFFTNETNKVITPLKNANKRGSSGSKWKQAYQAIKHNRKESLKLGNIRNLLHAMGALFILNLYYKDERFDLGRFLSANQKFDNNVGSSIFSVLLFNALGRDPLTTADDYRKSLMKVKFGSCIYIEKFTDESYVFWIEKSDMDDKVTRENFLKSNIINDFLRCHPDYSPKSNIQTCLDAGGPGLLQKILCFNHADEIKATVKKEAVLNKQNAIYPNLTDV